jgi:hypothetical protein
MDAAATKPWYRHYWPWLLAVPPAAAVVGGLFTLYLAVSRPDALVRKDCFRDGVTMVCDEEARRVLESAGRGKETRPAP